MTGQPSRAAKLDSVLAALEQLDLPGLRTRWRSLTGREAPATFRMPLLRAAIAYKLQERVYGGLKPGTRRLLRRVAEAADPALARIRGAAAGPDVLLAPGAAVLNAAAPERPEAPRRTPTEPLRIKPGTRLLRTWQGSTHEVLVGETGVTYRGQPYRSLSEVARLITGQRWSGPLFFGLKRRASTVAEPATELAP